MLADKRLVFVGTRQYHHLVGLAHGNGVGYLEESLFVGYLGELFEVCAVKLFREQVPGRINRVDAADG